jgi:hypothetical protein
MIRSIEVGKPEPPEEVEQRDRIRRLLKTLDEELTC